MEKDWQDVLDRFTYGIYLVTLTSAEGYNGMIASWVTQCSSEPPLIALAIRNNRLSHAQILESRKFCINVLPREFASSIRQFKIPDWKNKFAAFPHFLSHAGLPVLEACIGYLECHLEQTIDTGDHTLFIGRIVSGGMINPSADATLSTADYDGVYRGTS